MREYECNLFKADFVLRLLCFPCILTSILKHLKASEENYVTRSFAGDLTGNCFLTRLNLKHWNFPELINLRILILLVRLSVSTVQKLNNWVWAK